MGGACCAAWCSSACPLSFLLSLQWWLARGPACSSTVHCRSTIVLSSAVPSWLGSVQISTCWEVVPGSSILMRLSLSILDDLWVPPLPSIAIWMCVFPLEKSTSGLFYPAWQYWILVQRVATSNSTGFFAATLEWSSLLSLLNLSDLALCCSLNVLPIKEIMNKMVSAGGRVVYYCIRVLLCICMLWL